MIKHFNRVPHTDWYRRNALDEFRHCLPFRWLLFASFCLARSNGPEVRQRWELWLRRPPANQSSCQSINQSINHPPVSARPSPNNAQAYLYQAPYYPSSSTARRVRHQQRPRRPSSPCSADFVRRRFARQCQRATRDDGVSARVGIGVFSTTSSSIGDLGHPHYRYQRRSLLVERPWPNRISSCL